MNDVLSYFRERDPGFKSVPDNELSEYIYNRFPEFLKDPGFRADIKSQFATAAQIPVGTPDFVSDEALQRGRLSSAGQSALRGGGVGTGGAVSFLGRAIENLAPYFAGMDPSGQGLAIPEMDQAQAAYTEQQRKAALTPVQREIEVQQNPVYQAGRSITEGAREAFQPNPKYAGEFFTDVIPSSAGGMIPTFAAAMIAGPAGGMLQYGGSSAEQSAEDAIKAGRIDLANRAAALRFPVAAISEGLLGAGTRFGSRLLRPTEAVAGRTAAEVAASAEQRLLQQELDMLAKGAGRRMAEVGAREAAQESIEQLGENVIASSLAPYDPNRPLMQGVAESAAAGFLLGGGVGGVEVGIDAANRRLAESQYNTAYQDLLNQLAVRSVDQGTRLQGVPLGPISNLPERARTADIISDEGVTSLMARRLVPAVSGLESGLGDVLPSEGITSPIDEAIMRGRPSRPQPTPPQIQTSELAALEAAQASRYGAATRPIAEEPRETLGMSPEVSQRLRDLRAQEQLQLQQINEAAVQVPEARQPAVQEGGQGAQGPSRVDRQAEVREGQVPADVTGRSEVAAAQTQPWQDDSYRAGQTIAEQEFARDPNNPGLLRVKLPSDIAAYEAELNAANALPTRSARSRAIFEAGQKYGWQSQSIPELRQAIGLVSRYQELSAQANAQPSEQAAPDQTAALATAPAPAQPKVEPLAAAAAKLTYGDGSELATGDVTSLDKSVFGEEAAKVLGKTIIRGSVSQNPDGSVSVRVSNAGVTTRRTKAARATPTLAQKAGVSLGDVLTFKPLADGGFSVDRVSADGTAFPTVRIKKLKGLFNKQAAPSVQPETVAPSENDQKKSLVMQLIGGALENEKYNEFKRLLERSVFRGETDEGNQELDDFEDSLTDQDKIIFRAAFYREVGVDQMMDRFAKMAPGLSVDSTDLANKWDDALVGFVTRGLKDKAWANSWSPNTAQTSIVIDQIRKAQRSPLSLVEEPRPQGESTLTGQQARKEEIPPSESVDITSTADTRRFNARMFNRLAESIGAMERLNRGRRLNADQLRSAFDKEVAGFNREAFAEAFAGASADVIKTQLDGAFQKVLALYEQGGAARIADEADAYEAGETNVVELLSRAPQAPTGLPSNQVSARLQSQFGIPANALVRVVSEPNVDWDGRSLFRNGVLVGIQINAANLSTLSDVDKVMLHELSEAANANGELANEIKLITDQEASKIFIQVRLLGYDPSVFTREEDARKVEQLVNAWRGRNWFERVVGRVMAWASTKGVRLTRLAAEYVAAKAIAKVQGEVSRASTTASSGGVDVVQTLGDRTVVARAADSMASGAVEIREAKRKKASGMTTEYLSESDPMYLRNGWLLPNGAFLDTDPASAFSQDDGTGRLTGHAAAAVSWMERNRPDLAAAFFAEQEMANPDWNEADDGPLPISDEAATEFMVRQGWVRVAEGGQTQYIQGRPSSTQMRILRDAAIERKQRIERDNGPDRMSFVLYDPNQFETRESKTTFRNRIQVAEEAGVPGLLPNQQAVIERSAAAQAASVPSSIKARISAASDRSQRSLAWLGNISDLSTSPAPLSAMNPADPLTPMVASAVVGQIDRAIENRAKLVDQLERIQEEMASPKRAKQLAELATANAAANAAGAAYEALVKDFRSYNRQEILTYSGTDASLKNAITRASDSVRLLSAESIELRKAFEIMAEAVPPSVVSAAKAAKDTQPIVDYVTNNNVLTGKVRQSTIDLLLTPPAAGKKSPLQSYRGLASALTTISDYKADVEIAKADRKKFEDQFAATSPSAKAKSKRVDVEDFAKRYRNLRNAEADASERIRTISKEIDLLDSALLSTLEQIEILDEVIKSPEFSEAYQTATNILDLRLPEIVGGLDPKTGDEVFKIGGIEYRLPRRFDVTADQEAAAKVLEIYNAATARLDEIKNGSDPVRPDEVNALIQLQQRMAQYGHSVGDAALSTGPFNPIRLVRSLPFLRALVSRRHLARMIPGRLSSELSLLNSTGDSLEKAIDSLRRDKNVGHVAIDMAQFRAIKSHPDLTPMQWKVEVANELLNARQNDKDYMPEAGDTTPFGHVVTKEDIAAIKLMARHAHRYYGLTTGKDRGGIIRYQPTMILEGNRTRLPYMTGADMTPRRLIRDDSEGSPIYYAKLLVKALENPDMASRMAEIEKILSEPKAFQMMARRYVWETNSDFKNTSPYAKVYKALALQWWKDGKTAPKDLDELIEQIAMRVPAVGASVDIESAVKEALLSEIAASSKAAIDDAATSMSTATKYVQDGLGEPIEGGEPTSPTAIVSVVDSFNQFTKPRGAMVAPGIFYSYTLSTGEEMNGLAAAAMMPVRIRQLRALIDLKNAVSRYKTNLAERINSDPDSVKADVRSGKLYTDYAETNNLLNTLSAVTEVFKQRVESPNVHNESGLLKAWNAVHKTLLVSALTASVRNILFGIAGGDVAGRMMIRGGGSGSVGSAFLAGGPRVAVRLLERIFTNNPAAMSFIRANKGKLGVLGERLTKSAQLSAAIQNAARLGGWEVDEPSISERAAQVSETGTYGNVIQSRGQLQKSMLSKIERMFTPRLVAKVKESVFRFQPAGDQLANEMNAKDAMQRLALTFMSGYRIMQNRAATGVKGWDNWADPANIIKPAEAKDVAGWSPELLISLKQLVAPAGSLEYVLHDFYKRVEDAKSKGQDIYSVPPIADENALADVLIRVLSASNLPSDSSRADLIKTRSTLGQTLNFFWGFPGWINNWLDTLEGISSVSTERKAQIEKNVLPVLYMFTMLSLMALGGLWPNELMAIFYRIINGRPYPIMTARDFLESPSAKSLTKLMSVSLAGMVPYAGEYIAGYVGATQNKPNLTDLAKMSVPLGVLGNFAQALKTAWSTGDVGGAVLSMTRGTLPILNPVINRLPDVAARDAVNDAVRVASRNAGDLEMKTRGGAGGNEPTEFSSLIKRAVAANASGDSAGAQRLLNRAAEVKAATGVGDPWSAVKASLKSQLPEQKAFGRMLSADEKVGLRSRMSPEQRAVFDNGDRSVQQLVDGIKPKAEREGGGGMTAMRRIRALTRKPKAIRTIRTKLRKLRPMKLRLTRGGRSGSRLRVPKPLQMAALGPASRARRRPAGLMSPLGRGSVLGMPAASIGI